MKGHNLSRKNGKQTRLHRIWSNMKARCSTKSHQSYHNYGGRSISVCQEWFDSYLVFHKWATENGYSDDLTIERNDNDGNYEPDNCRWVTKGQQGKNQRTTKLTFRKAQKIRRLYREGIGGAKVAEVFGISPSHTRSIIAGIRWKSA